MLMVLPMRSPRAPVCRQPRSGRTRPPVTGCRYDRAMTAASVPGTRYGHLDRHRLTVRRQSRRLPAMWPPPRRPTGCRVGHQSWCVLLYSDDVTTRDAVRLGVGRRPGARRRGRVLAGGAPPPLPSSRRSKRGARPARPGRRGRHPSAGWACAKQLKNEIFDCPPDPRAHRPPAGRLARGLVPGRPRRAAPARPGRSGRGRRRARPPRRTPSAVSPTRRADGPGAAAFTWPDVLTTLLVAARTSPRTQRGWAMDQVMAGEATPAQVAGFLVALRAKGETVEEMRGLADKMLAARRTASRSPGPASTSSAPAATARTRSTSRRCRRSSPPAAGSPSSSTATAPRPRRPGSADVLEALGIDLGLPAPAVRRSPREAGITFCFAQVFHPSFRHAGGGPARARHPRPRSTSSARSPTRPSRRTPRSGVADARMAPLHGRGVRRARQDAAVFRGDDGLDELTLDDDVDGVVGPLGAGASSSR